MISRRQLLAGGAGFATGSAAMAAYGVVLEPARTPFVQSYAVASEAWPDALSLRVGVMADLHACEPWMPAERLRGIVEQVNALEPDLIVLLGDFNAGHRFVTGPVPPGQWGEALATLRAPLGTFAILGNHDWWHGAVPGTAGNAPEIRRVLRERNIRLLENEAVRIGKDGGAFWLAGLADQMAHRVRRGEVHGADDLHGTLGQVTTDDPVLLLAHEPFVLPLVPRRVALTLCGHTHGGQIDLPVIGAPFSPTRRYRYGHVVERGRHFIISGGLGESSFPIRIGVPPEINCVTRGGGALTA